MNEPSGYLRESSGRVRPDGEQGMTLVEVLVATMLLSVVVVAAVSLLTLTLRQNHQAEVRSIATSLASERIELLMSGRFRSDTDFAEYAIAGETAATGPPFTLSAAYGSIPDYPEFRRVVTLTFNSPRPGMTKAVVDVFWNDLQQGEKDHRLVTFLHPTLHTGL